MWGARTSWVRVACSAGVFADACFEFGGSCLPCREALPEVGETAGEVAASGCAALFPVHGGVFGELGFELGDEEAGRGELCGRGAFGHRVISGCRGLRCGLGVRMLPRRVVRCTRSRTRCTGECPGVGRRRHRSRGSWVGLLPSDRGVGLCRAGCDELHCLCDGFGDAVRVGAVCVSLGASDLDRPVPVDGR